MQRLCMLSTSWKHWCLQVGENFSQNCVQKPSPTPPYILAITTCTVLCNSSARQVLIYVSMALKIWVLEQFQEEQFFKGTGCNQFIT